MPYAIATYQQTPNPNALKCILDKPLPGPIRSYRSAEQAAGDDLGAALMGVAGVAGVLLSGGWLTVNKTPEAAWAGVKKGVERVLAGAA
jgi:hypothetical protein